MILNGDLFSETLDRMTQGGRIPPNELVEQVIRELRDTAAEQSRLNQRVGRLSDTVAVLQHNLGALTHGHDQLDARVRAIDCEIGQVRHVSNVALQKAENATHDVQLLREETARHFRDVNDQLLSIKNRLDELIASV